MLNVRNSRMIRKIVIVSIVVFFGVGCGDVEIDVQVKYS